MCHALSRGWVTCSGGRCPFLMMPVPPPTLLWGCTSVGEQQRQQQQSVMRVTLRVAYVSSPPMGGNPVTGTGSTGYMTGMTQKHDSLQPPSSFTAQACSPSLPPSSPTWSSRRLRRSHLGLRSVALSTLAATAAAPAATAGATRDGLPPPVYPAPPDEAPPPPRWPPPGSLPEGLGERLSGLLPPFLPPCPWPFPCPPWPLPWPWPAMWLGLPLRLWWWWWR